VAAFVAESGPGLLEPGEQLLGASGVDGQALQKRAHPTAGPGPAGRLRRVGPPRPGLKPSQGLGERLRGVGRVIGEELGEEVGARAALCPLVAVDPVDQAGRSCGDDRWKLSAARPESPPPIARESARWSAGRTAVGRRTPTSPAPSSTPRSSGSRRPRGGRSAGRTPGTWSASSRTSISTRRRSAATSPSPTTRSAGCCAATASDGTGCVRPRPLRNPGCPRDHGHLAMLDSSYGYLRRFTPQVLAAIGFAGSPTAGPLLEAVEILRGLNATGARKVPDGAPTAFVPTRWRGYLGHRRRGRRRHRLPALLGTDRAAGVARRAALRRRVRAGLTALRDDQQRGDRHRRQHAGPGTAD